MSGMRFDDEHEHDDSERWLLTYADMITLLLALFIVMFAMSSVNATKFQSLSESLRDAFDGKILGGESIHETGASVRQAEQSTSSETATTSESSPCSACAARSSSSASGSAPAEHTTVRSLGPAKPSIPMRPESIRLASCT